MTKLIYHSMSYQILDTDLVITSAKTKKKKNHFLLIFPLFEKSFAKCVCMHVYVSDDHLKCEMNSYNAMLIYMSTLFLYQTKNLKIFFNG